MAPKPKLTKSLHTITAVANVARYVLEREAERSRTDAYALTTRALAVLGYDITDFAKTDETIVRCVAAVEKVLS